jgi:transcriptional regulator with XRE-family HTH domain
MRARGELIPDGRRAELGDLLRRRRAELTTDLAGLPPTRRRRTPGLRREEVAELANISTALYAWLEQGRDVPVSRRTIDAIANALQFTSGERDHLFALATNAEFEFDEAITPTLRRAVASLHTHPVFILNHAWDVVLSNCAASVIFHGEKAMSAESNLLEAVFSENSRQLFLNWHNVAVAVVEMFRYDYPLYATESNVLALVDRLRQADPVFAAIWDEHRVRRPSGEIRQLNHRIAGLLSVEPSIYAVIESPGLRYMIFTPTDAATARQIGDLVARATTAAEQSVPTCAYGLGEVAGNGGVGIASTLPSGGDGVVAAAAAGCAVGGAGADAGRFQTGTAESAGSTPSKEKVAT